MKITWAKTDSGMDVLMLNPETTEERATFERFVANLPIKSILLSVEGASVLFINRDDNPPKEKEQCKHIAPLGSLN